MKTKTLFFSSLVAAAAMSTVPALAANYTQNGGTGTLSSGTYDLIEVKNGGTINQSEGTVYTTNFQLHNAQNNNTDTYNLSGGVLNVTSTTIEPGTDVALGHWPSGTGVLNVSGTGVLNVTSGLLNVSRDGNGTLNVSGGEVNVYGITLSPKKDSGNYAGNALLQMTAGRINVGVGGIIGADSSYSGTKTKVINLNGGTLGALDSWSSSATMTIGGNVEIDTTKRTTSESAASSAATGDNTGATITLSGNITQTAGTTLTVSGTGTLDLSGATVSLTKAISNGAKVTFDSTTAFVLNNSLKNENADTSYTLISNVDSGSITDWSTLSISNFRQADGTAFSSRSSVDVSADGVATITSVVFDLFWKGGTSGAWNTNTSDTVWGKDSASGDSTAFAAGDNVTFGTDGAVAVTVDSDGVSAGTMTVSAGDVTLSGGNVTANTANITAGTLTISSGTKLTTTSGITVNGTGTLKISSNSNIGGNVTVGTGGTFDVNGSTSDIGSNIGTITLAGGTLTNTGSSVGAGLKQLYTIAVTADSEINGTGNFGLIGSGYTATTLTLNGNTLTKKGTNTFWLVNATVSEGTLKISEGTVDSHDRAINGSAADFVIESAGTLNMGAGTLSAKSISGAGTVKFGSLSSLPTTFTTDWTGTVAFTSISDVSGVGLTLSNLGNSNSKIVFDGVSGTGTGQSQGLWFNPGTYNVNIEIASGGLTLTNGSSSSPVVLSGALSGTGTFEFAGTVAQAFTFTGDVSAFTGTLKSTTATFAFEGSSDQTFNGSIVGDDTTGAKITKSGSTKLTLAGTDTTINAKTLTVSAGTLEISSGTITLASAIANSGTVTVGSGAVFVLADVLKSDEAYTVISGGTIDGWNSLKMSNFRRSDGSEFSARSTVDVSTDGVAKISVVAWDLYWKGAASGGTWNTSTATNWGKDAVSGTDTAFQSGDNAIFSTSGASVSLGEAITAGTVTVSANTTLTATSANTLTADSISVSAGTLTLSGQQYVSAGSINIENGATLNLGTLGTGVAVSQKLTGTGTVSFTSTHGNTINLGTEFEGAVNISGDLQLNELSLGADTAKLNLMTGVHLWSGASIAPVINQAITFKNGESKIGSWSSKTTSITLSGGLTFDGGTLLVENGKGDGAVAVVLNINKSMTNAEITHNGGTTNISLSEDSSIKKITRTGGTVNLTQTAGTLTISGATEVSTLAISGGAVEVTGSGKLTGTVSSMAAGTTLTLAGTGDKSAITLSGAQTISGNLVIGNATVDASASGDIFNYNVTQSQTITLNQGGTLALGGSYRQSFNGYVSFVLDGGTITGDGDGYGAMDLYGANNITVKSNSEISATVRMRSAGSGGSGNVTIAVDDGAVLTVSGRINRQNENNTTRQIIKSGAGSMKLTADNRYFAAGFTVNNGTLVAANAKALGTGTTTVVSGAKLGLIAGTTVSGVTGGVVLNEGAKLVIDMTGQKAGTSDKLTLELVVGSALSYNGNAFNTDSTTLITEGVVVLENLDTSLTSWVKSLAYASDTKTLTLTMTVPEPSTFGLLAGVGALALVAARRRRRAK